MRVVPWDDGMALKRAAWKVHQLVEPMAVELGLPRVAQKETRREVQRAVALVVMRVDVWVG